MQIITLADAKLQLNITGTARDSHITLLVDGIEAELLSYIGVPTKAAALALVEAEMATVLEACLEQAVLASLPPKAKDASFNILTPSVRRMLFPFVIPAVSAGATE
jgi:hypothetical protein